VHAGAQDYLVKGQLNRAGCCAPIRYTLGTARGGDGVVAAEKKYRGIFDHLVEGIFSNDPGRALLVGEHGAGAHLWLQFAERMAQSLTDIGERLYVQPGRRERVHSHHAGARHLTGL